MGARALLSTALVLVAAAAVAGCGGSSSAEAPPTTIAGPKVLHIVFPEGFTRAQMAERVAAVREIARRRRGVTPRMTARGYLAATASSVLPGRFASDRRRRSLEGFLFPATYAFFSNDTARELVRRQLRTFKSEWGRVNLRYARSKNLTPYDVLTIASMIEREVIVPRERRLVAAVIYNRLHARMPLGIDATLRYGLGIPPTQAITASELASDSPYNTRRFPGLPPTPIANPGLASIQAAAHPAHVPYLYFVRRPDCRSHFFTASAAAFDAYTRKGLECSRGRPAS
ncbi:MAG: endolytic transglycosylase MltG [Candidatus Rokuibacteriota bacterium]|nr:MAG: endolytic transglycosylase MltG [Candidatus Rokubacteria bacterium]